MNIKRAFLVLAAALLMPGLALAQVLGPATFAVRVDFEDSNILAESVARISCNAGLPLNNQQDVMHGSELNFVLTFADEGPGLAECVITIDDVTGYQSTYVASGQSGIPTPDLSLINCAYNNVSDGHENLCVINMRVKPVTVVVTKDWEISNPGSGESVETDIYIEASSFAEIEGGKFGCYDDMWCLYLHFDGPLTDTESFQIHPVDGKTTVFLFEDIVDSAVESRNTCGNIFEGKKGKVTVYPGQGASCTFTNTVFFEGIPTLNQYGLAIMALLMLGVGFVGFRRFV